MRGAEDRVIEKHRRHVGQPDPTIHADHWNKESFPGVGRWHDWDVTGMGWQAWSVEYTLETQVPIDLFRAPTCFVRFTV